MSQLFDSISKLGWVLIAASISFLVYIFLEKFKSRWSLFSYNRSFNSLATTIEDNFHGSIKIVYNENRVVKHLNFITVTIKNESNVDFENVTVKCWVDVESQILSYQCHHDQYQTIIYLDEDFNTLRQDVIDRVADFDSTKQEEDVMPKDLQQDLTFQLRNIIWIVPVWNRKDSVTFNLLVENFKGQTPLISHPIEKKSVKLIEAESLELKNNRLGKWMIINGYIIYFLYSLIFFSSDGFEKKQTIYFAIIGGLYLWIGLFVYLFIRYIKSFFR